jgi:methionine--tRNA ligase beta chain
MQEKHYTCLGGCKGVSKNTGVCQAADCADHNHDLVECNCTDDKHFRFQEAGEASRKARLCFVRRIQKMDIRIGTIREVSPIEGADKLLKFMIDFGDPESRQILSGIREFFPEFETLVGKQALYIVNLEPRTIRGLESNGMLMAVDGLDGKPVFLTPEVPVAPGAKVR